MPSEDHLFRVIYDELYRLASTVNPKDSTAALVPANLVKEAWDNLAKTPELALASEFQFKQMAARAMRQVIRTAYKPVTFTDALQTIDCSNEEVLALDAALDQLGQTNPVPARLIEARFFGGLEIDEVAASLHVSENAILAEWRAARAWLSRHLRCESEDNHAAESSIS
jgi:RNA polymerase sigma factor (TIGR02999 family)